jgi:hypothetical protein
MANVFEPRAVDRPFFRRWITQSTLLIWRSPILFVGIGALLFFLDRITDSSGVTGAVNPLVLSFVLSFTELAASTILVAIARISDDTHHTRRAVLALGEPSLWTAVMMVAVVFALFFVIPASIFDWDMMSFKSGLSRRAETQHVLDAFIFQGCMRTFILNPWFLSLIIFATRNPFHAWILAGRAFFLNFRTAGGLGLAYTCFLFPLFVQCFPFVNLVRDVAFIFLNVFGYVAYRDIFERRAENQPVTTKAATTTLSVAANTAT